MPDLQFALPTAATLQELLIAAVIIIAFAVVARVVLYFLSTIIHRITHSTNTRVDDIILKAVRGPLFFAVMVWGVALASRQVTMPLEWREFIEGLVFVGYSLAAYFALYRLLGDLLDWYLHEKAGTTNSTLDDMILPFLRRLLLVVLTCVVIIMIMQYYDVQVGSLIATLGVGSLAVALAAQAALTDVISGFLILLDQRYRVGDRVELVDAGIVGDVTEIGLRTTRLLTVDHRMIIVPNSMIANNIVINQAYPDPKLRVDLPIGVAYGTDLRRVKQVLLEAIRPVEGVYTDRAPDVVFTGFGDNALNLEMRCWINAFADRPKMIDRVNMAAYDALRAADIEIPFPQRTLWHRVEKESIQSLQQVLQGPNGASPNRAIETNDRAAITPHYDQTPS